MLTQQGAEFFTRFNTFNEAFNFMKKSELYLAVGDSNKPYSMIQTSLQGDNICKKLIYTEPILTFNGISIMAEYKYKDANFHWQEWGIYIKNKLINRKVEDLWHKNGDIWYLTIELTIPEIEKTINKYSLDVIKICPYNIY